MNQGQDTPNLKIVLWPLAAEPLFLGALGLFLRLSGALRMPEARAYGNLLVVVFAAASLAMLWASFQFASGRFAPKTPGPPPDRTALPFGHMIVAVALAASPGILGFVHYLLCGADWVLLVFNLGSFALAARHVLHFTGSRR